MNVTVESLSPCKKLLRFELDLTEVDQAYEAALKKVSREVALPGFRPGKAPKELLVKKLEKPIQEEAERMMIGPSYKKAMDEHKLKVVGYPSIEKTQMERGKPATFVVTVETEPEFDLPNYRGLAAKRQSANVTEQDIEEALQALAKQKATFLTADRGIQENDFVVINYNGFCEGKPISELAPVARGLTHKEKFWIEVNGESFIPGFAPQLIGAKAGEKRTVTLTFPQDFITKEIAGKQGTFEVEIVEVKERMLPPIDDNFAKLYEAESLSQLKEGIRRDLQNELNTQQRRSVRMQVVNALLEQVKFELPENLVASETRQLVYQIVSENQQRGLPSEVLEQQKDSIFNAAQERAKDRVRADFIFGKIASKEGITVTPTEFNTRLALLAQGQNMTPQAFAKELDKRGNLGDVEVQILREKVIDFLAENAKIEDEVVS